MLAAPSQVEFFDFSTRPHLQAFDIALDTAWGRLLARVNADDAAHVREADAVGVAFEPAHVHLFAPGECGARI
jgi:hypothetical protein